MLIKVFWWGEEWKEIWVCRMLLDSWQIPKHTHKHTHTLHMHAKAVNSNWYLYVCILIVLVEEIHKNVFIHICTEYYNLFLLWPNYYFFYFRLLYLVSISLLQLQQKICLLHFEHILLSEVILIMVRIEKQFLSNYYVFFICDSMYQSLQLSWWTLYTVVML